MINRGDNMLTKREKMHLNYLANAMEPLWGGHLGRREPISAPMMQSWVDRGLIQAVGEEGYLLTEEGKRELGSSR